MKKLLTWTGVVLCIPLVMGGVFVAVIGQDLQESPSDNDLMPPVEILPDNQNAWFTFKRMEEEHKIQNESAINNYQFLSGYLSGKKLDHAMAEAILKDNRRLLTVMSSAKMMRFQNPALADPGNINADIVITSYLQQEINTFIRLIAIRAIYAASHKEEGAALTDLIGWLEFLQRAQEGNIKLSDKLAMQIAEGQLRDAISTVLNTSNTLINQDTLVHMKNVSKYMMGDGNETMIRMWQTEYMIALNALTTLRPKVFYFSQPNKTQHMLASIYRNVLRTQKQMAGCPTKLPAI